MDPLDGTTLVSQVRAHAGMPGLLIHALTTISVFASKGRSVLNSFPSLVHAHFLRHTPGQGRNGAVSVIALAERGALFDPGPCMYMEKLAGGGLFQWYLPSFLMLIPP